MPDPDNDHPDSDQKSNKLVATWRTVQKLDVDTWRKFRDDAPFRFIRWLAALGLIIGTWDVMGTPRSVTALLPPLAIVILLLLPDASSFTLGGFTWQARAAADKATQAAEKAERLALTIYVGAQVGQASGESAQARGTPAQSASEVAREFLE
jgi:hypothetical protein